MFESKLLLCDNTDISIDAIRYFRYNGIVCLSFPKDATHSLQPLEFGAFSPLQSKLKTTSQLGVTQW